MKTRRKARNTGRTFLKSGRMNKYPSKFIRNTSAMSATKHCRSFLSIQKFSNTTPAISEPSENASDINP